MSYISAPSVILILLPWTLPWQTNIDAQQMSIEPEQRFVNSAFYGLESCEDTPSRYVFLKGPTKVGEEIARVKAMVFGKPAQTYRIQKEWSETPFFIDENNGRISVKRPDRLGKNALPHNLTIIASIGNEVCYVQVFVISSGQKERTFYIPPTAAQQIRSSEAGTLSQLTISPDVIPYPTAPPSSNSIASSTETRLTANESHSPLTYEVTYVTFSPYGGLASNIEEQFLPPPRQINFPPLPGNPQGPSGSQQSGSSNYVTASLPIAFLPPGSAPGYGSQPQGSNPGQVPNGQVCSTGTCRPPPVCSEPLYTAIIPEGAAVGTSVMRASATGQGLQWTISDTAFERFTINPATGEVSVAGSLRRRTRAAMEFKIRATDMFGLWCDSIIRINVVPESPPDGGRNGPGNSANSQPYFVQNYYYFAIQCGAGPQQVGSVLATDLDSTQTITYQLINTNEFTIDARGNIQTTSTIQTSTDRTFYVVATDSGSPAQSATTTVTISVSGSCSSQSSSNTPPTFSQTTYTLTASCRVNNVFVGMTTATDYERNTVTYSVRGSQEFTVNPTSGEIRSQGTLTDSNPRTFSVVATDNGSPPMSAMVTVTVNVVNCMPQNNPPAFGQSSYQFTITCSGGSGTPVGTTQAYDTDGNAVVYTVTGTQEFTVGSTTGAISLAFPLQTAGVRHFSVVATDNGQPSLSVTAAITVIVSGTCQQVQTQPPQVQYPTQTPPPQYQTQPPSPIQPPTYAPAYPTQQPPAQYQTQPPSPIQYPTQPPQYSTQQPPTQYQTQPPSSVQYPTQQPQYPTQPPPPPPVQFPTQPPQAQYTTPSYVFTQPVTYPLFPTQQPSYSLPPTPYAIPTPPYPVQTAASPTTPVRTFPPVFSSQTYFFVAPCTNGTLTQIGSVQAVDPKGTPVTYNVVSGSPGYDVDYMTGTLVSLGPITAADLGQRTVVVAAVDGGSPRLSATTTVTIIIVGPCLLSSTPSSFPVPPTFPTFPAPPVTFPPSPPPTSPYFPPAQTAPPPYSTQPTYPPPANYPTQTPPGYYPTYPPPSNFPTQAPPPPSPPQPPQFSQTSYTFLMTCPLTANQLVGVVQATSSQAQVVTYSISGTSDLIVSIMGEVRTITLLSGPVVVNFQVTATDNLGGRATVQVAVSVPACQPISRPPTFGQNAYQFSVTCPNSANILIGTVTAQSSQGPQGLTYSLIGTSQFSVDNFGEIRSTVLLGSGQSYAYTIIAADARNPQLTATAQVTVNVGYCATQPPPPPVTFPQFPVTSLTTQAPVANAPPYFTLPSYTFTAVCNSQPNTPIGSVYAFDDRTSVSYSVQSQTFAINPVTGDIRTTSRIISSSPITLTVTATDGQGLTATATVYISITGCSNGNSNGPNPYPSQPIRNPQTPSINGPLTATFTQCDQSTSLVGSGTLVGTIRASGAGGGGSSQLQYTVSGDGRFTVSPYNGQIYTTTALDSGSYLFSIQVVDMGVSPGASATATFSLIVDCSSMGSRPCNPPYIETLISESAQVGTPVISVSNPGLGTVPGSGTGLGTPVSSSRPYSGPLTSSGSLNYVSNPTLYGASQPYAIVGGAYRRAVRHTAITASWRNSSVLVGLPKKYRQMAAGQLQQQGINTLTSGVSGGGGGGYMIQKASTAGVFRIDQNSGQITLAQSLDRERQDGYVLKIRSSISGQYCVTKVGIEVTDVNDNAPRFLNQSYVFQAPCGPPNAFVGVVTAQDPDSGLRGFVSYSILNSNNQLFGIDCFTGEIRLRKAVTPGFLPTTLMIQADNPTSPTQATTIAVSVSPGLSCS